MKRCSGGVTSEGHFNFPEHCQELIDNICFNSVYFFTLLCSCLLHLNYNSWLGMLFAIQQEAPQKEKPEKKNFPREIL